MKKTLCVLLAVLTLALAVAPAMAVINYPEFCDVMYVNCANGKTLNMRKTPGGDKMLSLENGTKVYVSREFMSMEWSEIYLENGKHGYVKTEFLQEKKPGKYDITERDDNFVEFKRPYIVTAKALNNKTDKSVGFRKKPNKQAASWCRLEAGDELLAVAGGKIWLKVIDRETGKTGYVAEDYVEFDHYLDEEEPDDSAVGASEDAEGSASSED